MGLHLYRQSVLVRPDPSTTPKVYPTESIKATWQQVRRETVMFFRQQILTNGFDHAVLTENVCVRSKCEYWEWPLRLTYNRPALVFLLPRRSTQLPLSPARAIGVTDLQGWMAALGGTHPRARVYHLRMRAYVSIVAHQAMQTFRRQQSPGMCFVHISY